ncbi:MAG: hypothetical protein R3E51_16270 [Rhizobiaceae bacterium]
MAITGIVEREIRKSGAFKEKLGDYAYAFSRTEKFDPLKAETILRDLFKARTGQTMNQMREGFAERESKLTRAQTGQAYDHAIAVGKMIEEGNKISFHRAFNHQATQLAGQLGITDAGAKRLMKEEFKTAEADLDFYEWGKDIEERFYKPQIEREKEQRERGQERDNGRERSRARDRNDDERSDQRAEPSEREPARREASRSRSRMEYRR